MDSQLISDCLELSDAAYYDDERTVQGYECVNSIHENGKGIDVDAKIYMNIETKIMVIAVRGTEDIVDALTDLDIRKYKLFPHSNILVHKGFGVSARVISNIAKIHIDELNPIRVYFTGHSLGGSTASILAIMMDEAISKYCVTFGSPRAGNKHFVRLFNQTVIESVRVVNGIDPITKVPPVAFGYRHVKGRMRIGDSLWVAIAKTYGSKLKALEYHFLKDYRNNL